VQPAPALAVLIAANTQKIALIRVVVIGLMGIAAVEEEPNSTKIVTALQPFGKSSSYKAISGIGAWLTAA
jgi:hypothetical protein